LVHAVTPVIYGAIRTETDRRTDRQTARVVMFVPVPIGRLNPPSKKQYTIKFSLDS
jgi:hypothetical protein